MIRLIVTVVFSVLLCTTPSTSAQNVKKPASSQQPQADTGPRAIDEDIFERKLILDAGSNGESNDEETITIGGTSFCLRSVSMLPMANNAYGLYAKGRDTSGRTRYLLYRNAEHPVIFTSTESRAMRHLNQTGDLLAPTSALAQLLYLALEKGHSLNLRLLQRGSNPHVEEVIEIGLHVNGLSSCN